MTEHPVPGARRPRRPQGSSLLGGVLIGALTMGALAPLVGSDRSTGPAAGAPEFLTPTSPTGNEGLAPQASSSPGPGVVGPGGTTRLPEGGAATTTGGGGTATGTGTRTGTGVGTGTTGSTGGVKRTASDVGVTSSTIRIGMVNLDCKGCAAFGITGTENQATQAEIAQAYADDLNARGGINGRKVQLVAADYDPVQDAANGGGTERAACIELTEHQKVFAVIHGGTHTNACIYDEHKTPLITYSDGHATDPDTFNKAGGRIWTLDPSVGRTALDWARQLQQQAIMTKSTTWGIVQDERTAPMMNKYFLPEMKRLGYRPKRIAQLPADPSAATVKIAQEVPTMRQAGVTHIVMATNFVYGANWVREAQRNGWKPQYVVADFGVGGSNYAGDQMAQGGNDWSGAILLSAALITSYDKLRQSLALKPCVATYERVRKTRIDDLSLINIANICTGMHLFEQAATQAGVNPTRQTFVRQLANVGRFSLPGRLGGVGAFGGRYSLGAVKWTAADLGQRYVWTNSCPYKTDSGQCYKTVGSVYKMAA